MCVLHKRFRWSAQKKVWFSSTFLTFDLSVTHAETAGRDWNCSTNIGSWKTIEVATSIGDYPRRGCAPAFGETAAKKIDLRPAPARARDGPTAGSRATDPPSTHLRVKHSDLGTALYHAPHHGAATRIVEAPDILLLDHSERDKRGTTHRGGGRIEFGVGTKGGGRPGTTVAIFAVARLCCCAALAFSYLASKITDQKFSSGSSTFFVVTLPEADMLSDTPTVPAASRELKLRWSTSTLPWSIPGQDIAGGPSLDPPRSSGDTGSVCIGSSVEEKVRRRRA
ncbi:hypothetical protein THAOC_22956 [Thalassiosira oceanica]|uniref:Uncharacterized protein n=1 Tax=Thalassiosira oceanica TaxID=159749 RepID=K0S822_THAOC|nr:hypothetical protein THAOC_22956 [Thalassiosira oceanica]|eukprot:EJK57046.1 hypothetical protein THAOC_22956 [Thalassiosira oceanica]